MNLVDALRQKDTLTENGAVTHSTSLNPLLDLFFVAGASRSRTEDDIVRLLSCAFNYDAGKALKICFWAGDVRGGAGERRFFKIALRYIKEQYPETFNKNLDQIPEFSRWDVLFEFFNDTNVLKLVSNHLNHDSLLAKWMPREGKASHQNFRKAFLKHTGLSPKEYRKKLSMLSKTVEQQMSRKDFENIKYSTIPSVAFNKYRKAFYKRDEGRFTQFIENVKEGKEKINAGAIFPHDIFKSYKQGGDHESINAQWSQLPNYLEGSNRRILPVCDVSGSMIGDPMNISVALGVYLSERNIGTFKDAFLTFSSNPKLQYLIGSTTERFKQLRQASWGYSTNLQATFRLILEQAKGFKVPSEEMPTDVLIISDMEFDQASGGRTNLEAIKEKYEESGYELPNLIFWNVNSRSDNYPVSTNDQGVALVSGASPSVVKGVLGGDLTPEKVLENTCFGPRYDVIQI